MKKPDKHTQPKAYLAWVRGRLRRWDPSDDHGKPDVYVPRYDGVKRAPCKKRADTFDALEKLAVEKHAKDH